MKKIIPLCFIVLVFVCVDCTEQEANPLSQPVLRAEKMSHGSNSYRLQGYDNENQINRVTSGLIGDDADSVESHYAVVHLNGKIQKIVNVDNSDLIEFQYAGERILTTHVYNNGTLFQKHIFEYDDQDRVHSWIVLQQTPAAGLSALDKKTYTYDNRGNAIKMEYAIYENDAQDFTLTSTTYYEDFDAQKNSSNLFINFYHPYLILFQNNPHTWRIANTNSSEGVTSYIYEYNAEGYVTRQRTVNNSFEIVYYFSKIKN